MIKMKQTIKNLKKVYKYGSLYKMSLILQILGSLIGMIISIVLPIIISKYVVYFTNEVYKQTIIMAATILCLQILRELKTILIRKNTQILHCGISKNLRKKLAQEILKIEQKQLDETNSGIFTNRMNSDTENMSAMFTTGCGNLFGVISNLGSFIAVLIIDYHMFIYYLISSIILTLLNLVKTKKYGLKNKEYRNQCDKTQSITYELIKGTKDIKMLNIKDNIVNRLDKNIEIETNKKFEMRNIDMEYNLLIGITKSVLEFGSILYILYLIGNNILSIPIALALYNYKDSVITNLMASIASLIDESKEFNISCDRVFEIINNKKYKKETFGNKKINDIKGDFEFKDVTFGYNEKNVFKKLSFKIKSGTTIGIVGKSGVGKTTIFNLLCKMYEPNKGKILIDDIDIKELDEKSIRNNITIINQNPYIFNMSIKDNLKIVKNNLTYKEMKKACELACLDDFIESLPNKYDTIIGENGVNLSGGQKQRLAIARALIQKTKIILFDEATSALDNETQSKIQTAIDNLKGEYTILIIAHRISTIVNCDEIMVLQENGVIEKGIHNYLLENNKEYKKLCKKELL